MKRTKESLRALWDNIKCTSIRIIRVPEEEEKKKGYEKIFEEIIVENFSNMEKEIVNQVQEGQRVPYRINSRRNTPRSILIKLTKTKHKERLLKGARERQQVAYKGNSIHLRELIFQHKLCRPEGNGRIYLKYWKGKIYIQEYCTQQGSHSKLMEEIKRQILLFSTQNPLHLQPPSSKLT